MVCASPKYLREQQPKNPKQLEQHNCLLFPLAGFRTKWIFRESFGNTQEISVRGNTIISNAIALQECAVAGIGLALLPHWLIDRDINTGRLVNLFPDYEVISNPGKCT
jgi:DNA-binding transcriptional LysR family regulator